MRITAIFYITIMISSLSSVIYTQEITPNYFEWNNNKVYGLSRDDVSDSSNAKDIAKDISLYYNETNIKNSHLNNLPPAEINAVFMTLDSGNITKVLLNIPVDDIKEIQNKLSEEEFNNILNRVSIENQTQIKERINNN